MSVIAATTWTRVAVVVVMLVAALGGYVAAPRPGAVAAAAAGMPIDVALVTVTPQAPDAAERRYLVEAVADGPIRSVSLMAGGNEVDLVEPAGEVTVLRTELRTDSLEPVEAVVTLADGRQAASITVDPSPAMPPEQEPWIPTTDPPTDGQPEFADEVDRQPLDTRITWDGPGRLVDGILQVDDPEVGRAFAYISDDGVDWHRVPALAGTSVALVNGMADVRDQLPSLGTASIRMELWRDDPYEVAMLGVATASAPDGLDVVDALGEIGLLGRVTLGFIERPGVRGADDSLTEYAFVPPWDADRLHFKWGTDLPGVTHVLWQAYANGGPIGPPNPLDPSAVRVGIATRDDDGRFVFDPPAGKPDDNGVVGDQTELDPASTGQAATPLDIATTSGAISSGATSIGSWLLDPAPSPPTDVDFSATTVEANMTLAGSLMLPDHVDSWTLRALAFAGDHYLGVASNLVTVRTTFDFGNLPTFVEGDYELEATVTPPAWVDPSWAACYRVVGINEGVRQFVVQANSTHALQYAVLDSLLDRYGTTLCLNACYHAWAPATVYNAWGEDTFGASFEPRTGSQVGLKIATGTAKCDSGGNPFVDALVGLGTSLYEVAGLGYDLVESTYNGAKKLVVEIVVELSGCKQAVGTVASDDDTKTLCNAAANVAVDAVMIYYGLPTELPNREQLIENAKGDLAQMLVELAKAQGVPCDELAAASELTDTEGYTCKEVADAIVDKATAEIGEALRANAQAGRLPFPPGVQVVQEPRAVGQPLQVRLTTVPEPGTLLPETCEATVLAHVRWTPPFHPTEFPLGALYAEPTRVAGNGPWAIPFREYIGIYGSETVTIAKPTSSFEPASVDVYLAPPSANWPPVEAYRWVEFNLGAPEQRTWSVPHPVTVLRPGAKVSVTVVSDCAGYAFADTTIPWFSVPGGP